MSQLLKYFYFCAIAVILFGSPCVHAKAHRHKSHSSETSSESKDIVPVNMRLLNHTERVIDNSQNVPLASTADPINSVGKTRQIVAINRIISILNKPAQEQLYVDSFAHFFGDTNNLDFFDPYTVYDELSNRFFLTITANPAGPSNVPTTLFIAVSKDDEPNGSDDFYKFSFEIAGFFDYQKMAVDKDALYVSANNNAVPNTPGLNNQIFAFRKASLLNGQGVDVVFTQATGLGVPPAGQADIGGAMKLWFPAQPHLNKCFPYQVYFIQAVVDNPFVPFAQIETTEFTGNQLRVMVVEDILTNPTVHIATVMVDQFSSKVFIPTPVQPPPLLNPPPFAQAALNTFPIRFQSAIVDRGSVWAAHTATADNATRALAKWYQVKISKLIPHNSVTLIQQGAIETGQDEHTYFPAINVDQDGNMGISFSLSSAKRYISTGYTGRLRCDPLGTVRLPVHIAQEGTLYYQRSGTSAIRWGDYSGLALDPSNDKTFWLFNMDPIAVPITTDTPFGADWSTIVAAFQINKGCPDLLTAPG